MQRTIPWAIITALIFATVVARAQEPQPLPTEIYADFGDFFQDVAPGYTGYNDFDAFFGLGLPGWSLALPATVDLPGETDPLFADGVQLVGLDNDLRWLAVVAPGIYTVNVYVDGPYTVATVNDQALTLVDLNEPRKLIFENVVSDGEFSIDGGELIEVRLTSAEAAPFTLLGIDVVKTGNVEPPPPPPLFEENELNGTLTIKAPAVMTFEQDGSFVVVATSTDSQGNEYSETKNCTPMTAIFMEGTNKLVVNGSAADDSVIVDLGAVYWTAPEYVTDILAVNVEVNCGLGVDQSMTLDTVFDDIVTQEDEGTRLIAFGGIESVVKADIEIAYFRTRFGSDSCFIGGVGPWTAIRNVGYHRTRSQIVIGQIEDVALDAGILAQLFSPMFPVTQVVNP